MVSTLPGAPAKTKMSATNLVAPTTGGGSLTTIPVGDCDSNFSGDTDLLMNMKVNMNKNKNMINVNNVKQQQQQPDIICRHPVTVPVSIVAGPFTTITEVIEIHMTTTNPGRRRQLRNNNTISPAKSSK